ncbi:hypothetical protein N803_13800 [Knoellia subterranea KCTC 19937]|uniref:Uncharacterized protein n=1 Tax=Knoellia subterranea KCTC 19937 TaxID=1385521 RepID=A0A0A0JKH0_9MICO|nr:hypothetical protein N803_13800 [Knoellia subterranea KCTC 19937]
MAGAGLAQATPASATTDVYEVAAATPTASGDTAEPQAIPGIVAVATVAARGFTAARAPQQVAQVARAAGWLSGIGLFGVAQVQNTRQLELEKAYFDR